MYTVVVKEKSTIGNQVTDKKTFIYVRDKGNLIKNLVGENFGPMFPEAYLNSSTRVGT